MGRGRAAALAASRGIAGRRVLVKVEVARPGRGGARRLAAHLAYITRDGVGRDGCEGRAFDAAGAADAQAFGGRCAEDPHQFRIVVSPEDAAELADLRAMTRDLMAQAERDLGTRLDWLGVAHWNTPHPHVHLVVRGRDERDHDLVISPDYISRGLRGRAEALVGLELGSRPRLEIDRDLQRQIGRRGWTELDAQLSSATAAGWLTLDERGWSEEPRTRPLLIARAEALERFGLAVREAHDAWRMAEDWQARLRAIDATTGPLHARGRTTLEARRQDRDVAEAAGQRAIQILAAPLDGPGPDHRRGPRR